MCKYPLVQTSPKQYGLQYSSCTDYREHCTVTEEYLQYVKIKLDLKGIKDAISIGHPNKQWHARFTKVLFKPVSGQKY